MALFVLQFQSCSFWIQSGYTGPPCGRRVGSRLAAVRISIWHIYAHGPRGPVRSRSRRSWACASGLRAIQLRCCSSRRCTAGLLESGCHGERSPTPGTRTREGCESMHRHRAHRNTAPRRRSRRHAGERRLAHARKGMPISVPVIPILLSHAVTMRGETCRAGQRSVVGCVENQPGAHRGRLLTRRRSVVPRLPSWSPPWEGAHAETSVPSSGSPCCARRARHQRCEHFHT